MAGYAYLRVSNDREDVDNQRCGLLDYAKRQGWGPLHFIRVRRLREPGLRGSWVW